jgi:hypothetical protein
LYLPLPSAFQLTFSTDASCTAVTAPAGDQYKTFPKPNSGTQLRSFNTSAAQESAFPGAGNKTGNFKIENEKSSDST